VSTQILTGQSPVDAVHVLEQLLEDAALTTDSFLAGARRLVAAAHADAATLLMVRELLQQTAPSAQDSRVRAAALARLDIAIADVGEAELVDGGEEEGAPPSGC